MSDITIVVGTVYGGSEIIANLANGMFKRAGHCGQVLLNATTTQIKAAEKLLFITSTTGQGDLPDNIKNLVDELEIESPDLKGKPYGVIAFGDRGYGKTFCRAGKQVNILLQKLKGKEMLNRLEVDAVEFLDPEEPVVPWLNSYMERL